MIGPRQSSPAPHSVPSPTNAVLRWADLATSGLTISTGTQARTDLRREDLRRTETGTRTRRWGNSGCRAAVSL